MKLLIAVVTAAAVALAGVTPAAFVTAAKADFEAPPPPPPPPDPSPDPEPQKEQAKPGGRQKYGNAALVAAVCLTSRGILSMGQPQPLKKMSGKQLARFRIEVARYNRARLMQMGSCSGGAAAVGNAAGGVIVPVILIAGDDFRMRFITKEIPIKRTARQEQMMFCRDGSAPCPSLRGIDPDLYGPK